MQSKVKGKKKKSRKLNNLDVSTCLSLTSYLIVLITSLIITLLFKLKIFIWMEILQCIVQRLHNILHGWNRVSCSNGILEYQEDTFTFTNLCMVIVISTLKRKCPGVRTYSDAWILYPSHLNEDKVTPNYQLSNILLELVDDPTYKLRHASKCDRVYLQWLQILKYISFTGMYIGFHHWFYSKIFHISWE